MPQPLRRRDGPDRPPGTRGPWGIVVFVFAVAAGATVSVLYTPQPIIEYVAAQFNVSAATAAGVAAVSQVGYAIGVLLLVPIGEIWSPRRLIQWQMGLTAAALVACAAAPSFALLCCWVLIAGAGAGVVQLLSPLATRLAPAGDSDNAVAAIVAGSTIGVFGGRSLATAVADLAGWRTTYIVSAIVVSAAVLALSLVLDRHLPVMRRASYASTLRSMPRLLRTSPSLRVSSAIQFVTFSAFNAGWTVAVLGLSREHGFTAMQAAAFSLVGLAASVVLPFVGRFVALTSHTVVRVSALGAGVLSTGVLLLCPGSLVALGVWLAGLAVMNFVAQVPNQMSTLAEVGDAGMRANALFIFSAFLGGAVGTQAGAQLFQRWGLGGTAWYCLGITTVTAVCLLSAALRRSARGRRQRTAPGSWNRLHGMRVRSPMVRR